jgi:hypothetical protein
MVPKPTEFNHRELRKRPPGLIRITPHLTWLLCASAFAQSAIDAQLCEDSGRYRNIRTTDPGRQDRPLRQDNISDEEVS